MRHEGSAPGLGEDRLRPADGNLGLDELARALDGATVNMCALSLDALRDAAANENSPLAGSDTAHELANQLTRQLRELEAAIAEVMRGSPSPAGC